MVSYEFGYIWMMNEFKLDNLGILNCFVLRLTSDFIRGYFYLVHEALVGGY